jgi:predicted small integral membrane protein
MVLVPYDTLRADPIFIPLITFAYLELSGPASRGNQTSPN